MQIESWKEFIRGDLKMYPKYVFLSIWKTFFLDNSNNIYLVQIINATPEV